MFSSPCKGFVRILDTTWLTPSSQSDDEVEVRCVFLLWTPSLHCRSMSLPGVFGGIMYGLTERLCILGWLPMVGQISTQLPDIISRLGVDGSVHSLFSSLPGVFGRSWNGDGFNSEGTESSSALSGEAAGASSAELSSDTKPLPGVCGRSISSAAGDVGLVRISRSGSPSPKEPVGVRGLRCSAMSGDSTVHSGLCTSKSKCGSADENKHILIISCYFDKYSFVYL